MLKDAVLFRANQKIGAKPTTPRRHCTIGVVGQTRHLQSAAKKERRFKLQIIK